MPVRYEVAQPGRGATQYDRAGDRAAHAARAQPPPNLDTRADDERFGYDEEDYAYDDAPPYAQPAYEPQRAQPAYSNRYAAAPPAELPHARTPPPVAPPAAPPKHASFAEPARAPPPPKPPPKAPPPRAPPPKPTPKPPPPEEEDDDYEIPNVFDDDLGDMEF